MKSEEKIFTYQTRLYLPSDQSAILDQYADLLSKVERKLFAKICAKKNLNEVKRQFLIDFGITARQFNACKSQIDGKIESIKKLRVHQIEESKNYISELEKKIEKLSKKKDYFALHQKKCRLFLKKRNLNSLISDHNTGVVRVCFGSKKTFNSQFNLDPNDKDFFLNNRLIHFY